MPQDGAKLIHVPEWVKREVAGQPWRVIAKILRGEGVRQLMPRNGNEQDDYRFDDAGGIEHYPTSTNSKPRRDTSMEEVARRGAMNSDARLLSRGGGRLLFRIRFLGLALLFVLRTFIAHDRALLSCRVFQL